MKKLSTEIRKEQFIRAVLKVIAEEGSSNLSVARVSREAGLVPSALYRHFHSKEQMLDAVLEFVQERMQNNFREAYEQTENPVERMRLFLEKQLKLIQESPALPTIVLGQGLFSDDKRRREKIHNLLLQFRQRLGSIVKMGQKSGIIRKDVPADTIVLLWVGIIQPAALIYHVSKGKYNLEKHQKEAWKLFYEMITPKRKTGRK